MINYIGQSQKEKSNSIIRVKIKKQKSFFTLLLLLLPFIFLLFENYPGLSPEKNSGDRMATCKLTNPNGGTGTAFLVGKNGLLITARHCVDDLAVGETVSLNFDKIKEPGFDNLQAEVVFFPEDIKDDFAVIKLIKKLDIIGLEPPSNPVEDPSSYNPKINIIGYPGIANSQSIAQNYVINYQLKDSTIFMVEQSFPGYSGGPVIDIETGDVIGILVSGITESENEWMNQYIGLAFCEKIEQVFIKTPHLNW
jgi:S1-C subfamily serine protease